MLGSLIFAVGAFLAGMLFGPMVLKLIAKKTGV